MTERGFFTDAQRDILLQPVADWRVQELDGQSHLAGWDVIAHLNRLFGFEGWDKEILDLALVYEHIGTREVDVWESGRKTGAKKTVPACSVGYRCTLRLVLRDVTGRVVRTIDDTAMGTATNQRDMGDAHDLALKSAVTYALKRCAKDLGDQFGLSLYNRGQLAACVGKVAVYDGHSDVASHEGRVHADGISEGDEGFGAQRGEGEAVIPADQPAAESEPEPQPEAAPEPPPVREPEPAKPKAEKPEATPPPAKPEVPTVDEEEAKDLTAEISTAETVDAVKEIWKRLQAKGQLDALVFDFASEKQVTLREFMVARVNAIEVAA